MRRALPSRFSRIFRLGFAWLAAGAAMSVQGETGGGERSAPRIKLTPSSPTAGSGEAAAAELLPALPPGEPVEPPRKTSAAGVQPLPPDVPPLGLPSDGEEAPSFPDLPDLPESSLLPQTPADEPAQPMPPTPESEGGQAPAPAPAPPRPPGSLPVSPASPRLDFPVWHESPKKARTLSQVENRCLLLVFSNSIGEAGGTSKRLNDEVLAASGFNEFALDHLVLCGLFYSPTSGLDLKDPTKIAQIDALAALKKSFKVRGFPCLILFGPDGREINRWTGFVTGRGPWLQQQIKQSVEGHEAQIFATERRREQLASRGYRTWTSAQGTPIFAKLVRFDAESAVFLDEAGAERTVRLKQLTMTDREVITRQRLGRPMPERMSAPITTGGETTLR